MEKVLYLSAENLEEIKKILQVELLKRGVTAPIEKIEESISRNGDNHYVHFQTSEFQTVPVMFKRVQINNFGSSVSERLKSALKSDLEGSYLSVWISVHYSWESFDGGTNGTKMFDIHFNVFGETYYDVKLHQIN